MTIRGTNLGIEVFVEMKNGLGFRALYLSTVALHRWRMAEEKVVFDRKRLLAAGEFTHLLQPSGSFIDGQAGLND